MYFKFLVQWEKIGQEASNDPDATESKEGKLFHMVESVKMLVDNLIGESIRKITTKSVSSEEEPESTNPETLRKLNNFFATIHAYCIHNINLKFEIYQLEEISNVDTTK